MAQLISFFGIVSSAVDSRGVHGAIDFLFLCIVSSAVDALGVHGSTDLVFDPPLGGERFCQ